MKTKLIILSLSLLLISCGGNTARKNYDEAKRKEQAERDAFRHDYWSAELLYDIAHSYGLLMDKKEFHQAMESPAKAEAFLNNLFDEGILDERKDIREWIVDLYNGLPSELSHLDLGKCIDTIQLGTDDDVLDLIIDEPEQETFNQAAVDALLNIK